MAALNLFFLRMPVKARLRLAIVEDSRTGYVKQEIASAWVVARVIGSLVPGNRETRGAATGISSGWGALPHLAVNLCVLFGCPLGSRKPLFQGSPVSPVALNARKQVINHPLFIISVIAVLALGQPDKGID